MIFECKSRGRAVTVETVDEFTGRLQSGLGFRPKGFIVSDAGFSQAAINTARHDGIGLIRMLPDDQVRILLYYMTPDVLRRVDREFPARASRALRDPDYCGENESVFAAYDGYVFQRVEDVARAAIAKDAPSGADV